MTNPSTIAASLTPKMREALEGASEKGVVPNSRGRGSGSVNASLVAQGISEYRRLPGTRFNGLFLTPLGIAVREALLEGKGDASA